MDLWGYGGCDGNFLKPTILIAIASGGDLHSTFELDSHHSDKKHPGACNEDEAWRRGRLGIARIRVFSRSYIGAILSRLTA